MRNTFKILMGIDIVLILFPILIFLLIKLEKDVYGLRTFITEQIAVIFSLFISVIVVAYFLKQTKLVNKIMITIVSLVGIIIYYLMYDILLPF